jgi:hypothetical protein
MEASHLISTWNTLRKSIVNSQMASVIVLSVALALVATGQFVSASLEVKLFAIAVIVATGALSLINQFAAIREGSAVAKDLAGADSATGKAIASSANYMKLTQVAMIILAVATLVFFVLAIF